MSTDTSRVPCESALEDSARRILRTTGVAASSGAALGLVLAMRTIRTRRSAGSALRQAVSSASTSAASLGMLGLVYSAAKEYSRTLTGTESAVNSAVGGAAAGGLLFASHGGNPVLGAAIVAAIGAGTDAVLGRRDGVVEMVGVDSGETGDGGDKTWWSMRRWVRKTSDEERKEFLEKRRKRIQREEADGTKKI